MKELDSANHPGVYEFHFADARFSVTSSRILRVSVIGAANLLEREFEIELVQYNPYDAVRMGMTGIANAVAGAAGGLAIVGSKMDLQDAVSSTASNVIADALLDRANAIETGVTPRQAMKVGLGADAGVTAGMATATALVKNPAGTKTRVTATTDADGNRTAITLTDLT
jgi:hypothetical protein